MRWAIPLVFSVLSAVFGTGCRFEQTYTPAWTSGSRLRANLAVAGGAKSFTSWRDVKLGVDCAFDLASDGSTRCLPLQDGVFSVLYMDSSCTHPIAELTSDAQPRYLFEPATRLACGKGPPVHEVGPVVTPDAVWDKEGEGGPCLQVGIGPTLVDYGPVVDPTTFVKASESMEARGPRLSARILATEDGARQVAGLYDFGRDEPCDFDERDGRAFCTPSRPADAGDFFIDDACTVPAAVGDMCPKPMVAYDSSRGGFFTLGVEVTSGYYPMSRGCADATGFSASVYRLGDPIPMSAFAPLVLAHEGSGRIHIAYAHTPTGEPTVVTGFYDTEKQVRCRASKSPDGKVRCLPDTPTSAEPTDFVEITKETE